MNDEEPSGCSGTAPGDTTSIEPLVRSLANQLSVVMSDTEQIERDCSTLTSLLTTHLSTGTQALLATLLPPLAERSGPEVRPLFGLLEHATALLKDPWPLLKGMLRARDAEFLQRSLQLVLLRTVNRSLKVDRPAVEFLARRAREPDGLSFATSHINLVAEILRRAVIREDEPSADPILEFFLQDPDPNVRALAARILDLPGDPVSHQLIDQVIPYEAVDFLRPYLLYSRATHQDLLFLQTPAGAAPVVEYIRRAHTVLGEDRLRQIITEIGWQHLNLGLDARPVDLVAIGDSVPLALDPQEVKLARRCGDIHVAASVVLVIAHGGAWAEGSEREADPAPASQFREYNLLHARVLGELLLVAPLTRERALGILESMDRIVQEFGDLFGTLTEEGTILGDVYGTIKSKILEELNCAASRDQLSLELTRLVAMFEDPPSLGQVETLHGLKRYLHQKGLQLGFRLIQGGTPTNRTVDVLVVSGERILSRIQEIRYADFEPDTEGTQIPYAVKIVAEGFARQALLGQEGFPRVDIFCYGNEVQYFLAFKNHPAFLRINYAPPLQGGMIDLEYYGVSKYELADHPDPSLHALSEFFRRLDFDIQICDTRVHARYDKEQAPDLASLCDKAEAMFRLAPYLLDIDWTIGGLRLDDQARTDVKRVWAEHFEEWGTLPLRYLLSGDRQSIVESCRSTPSGRQEIAWSGKGPYRDRFSTWPDDFFSRFIALTQELGLEEFTNEGGQRRRLHGQLSLERAILMPLRRAQDRGEVRYSSSGDLAMSTEMFRRVDAAEIFADIIAGEDGRLEAAGAIALFVNSFEQVLPFRTTGSVGPFEVQCACVPLRGSELALHVLRDEGGAPRLAFYTHGPHLFRRREGADEPWQLSARFDRAEFHLLIRRANYPAPSPDQLQAAPRDSIGRLRAHLARTTKTHTRSIIAGERTLSGIRASPGPLAGRALFGTEGRLPSEVRGSVLVTPSMRPEDAPFLYNAAGIVTTGGGILSHAGLLAVQFRKPALIVAGRWERTDSGAPILQFVSVHYEIEEKELHGYQVCFRRNLREREHTLHEGDLLVLEAGESTLRILGQDGDTLALHESMRELNRVTAELAQTSREHEILRLRGDRIRARHHIENVLQRLGDPPLICHAVSGLLTGSTLSAGEIQRLLCILLNNPAAASTAQRHLDWKAAKLLEQFEDASGAAQRRIPDSDSLYEILNLRLDVLHAHHTLHDAWVACPTPKSTNAPPKQDIDRMIDKLALDRLACLQQLASERVASLCQPTVTPLCRHVLRQGERLDLLIGSSPTIHTLTAVARDRLFELDRRSRDLAADRLVVWPEDGGLELFPVVGWKAANLAEIARATARPIVPGWFVVTDRAFQRALDSKLDRALATGFPAGINLLGAIQTALRNDRFNDQQQSALIRTLWDAVILPGELVEQVLNAYRHLAQQVPPDDQQLQQRTEPMVALRSSSHEEDAEFATRAGEFDTFLFIRGARQLMDFLRRTWAGLWSERALHHRSVLGTSLALVGGGVIVQRIVDARVSGVVQTVNLALNDYRQMVVNVGLGLGQGIVSGAVAADHVVIDKCAMPPQSPLRFRYTTAEKREAVVFDRRAGYGTVQCGAPFHRRRRPALEYAELCELVSVVTELESIYGYPLDIEFALEGTKLWILQARPVPASMNSFQESVSTWTLPHTTHTSSSPQGHHTHDQARRVS